MDETAHFRMEEEQAIGAVISACAKAIFDSYGCETMAGLQRAAYKYTPCGPDVSFELFGMEDAEAYFEAPVGLGEPRSSPFVYVGDERSQTISEPWKTIKAIGVSSIIEGSDAEVPLEWIDLESLLESDDPEGEAVRQFDELLARVNDEASELWAEANEED